MNSPHILKDVKEWAAESWENAIDPWTRRPAQDYVYRHHIVEPALARLISESNFEPLSLITEIGCGDGTHTVFWRRQLDDVGLGRVRVVGVDLFRSLIVQAGKNTSNHRNISFLTADVTLRETVDMIHQEVGVPDVMVAMFLLQDVPDLIGLMEMVTACLRDEGHFIAVLVHPDFAEQLMSADCIQRPRKENLHEKYVTESGLVQWRFIGHYPIAREDAPPFYLPYFHRTLADYYEVLYHFNFDVIAKIPLGPDEGLCDEASSPGEPFRNTKWNVYWPYIKTGPSSILIHAIKRETDLQWECKRSFAENQSPIGPSRVQAEVRPSR